MPAPSEYKETLYEVSFGQVSGRAVVREGVVVQAPPALWRFVGRPWNELWGWVVYRRDGTMRQVICKEAVDAG